MNTAFEGIWDEFNIPLRRYITRRVNNNQDVEDIVQTVFQKLLSNLHKLEDEDKLHAWVYSITRNAIIDFYKSQKRELNIDDYIWDIQMEADNSSKIVDEIAQGIQIMIQYLPEKYKEAIILTEFQNLTQKEMANRLGLSIPGAKSRVQRARKQLKTMLLNCCDFEKDCRGNIIDYKRKDEKFDCCIKKGC